MSTCTATPLVLNMSSNGLSPGFEGRDFSAYASNTSLQGRAYIIMGCTSWIARSVILHLGRSGAHLALAVRASLLRNPH